MKTQSSHFASDSLSFTPWTRPACVAPASIRPWANLLLLFIGKEQTTNWLHPEELKFKIKVLLLCWYWCLIQQSYKAYKLTYFLTFLGQHASLLGSTFKCACIYGIQCFEKGRKTGVTVSVIVFKILISFVHWLWLKEWLENFTDRLSLICMRKFYQWDWKCLCQVWAWTVFDDKASPSL